MQPAERIVPTPKVEPGDRLGAVAQAAAAALGDADLGNVIVLAQRRRTDEIDAPAVTVNDNERPAPPLPGSGKRRPWTAVVVAALLLHFAVALVFLREPPPLASIGLESISVELVLGADQNAGVAEQPSETESLPAPDSRASEAEREAENPPQHEDAAVAEREPEQAEQEPEQTVREPEKPDETAHEPEQPAAPEPERADTQAKPADPPAEVAEEADKPPQPPAETKSAEAPPQPRPEKPVAVAPPKPAEKPTPKQAKKTAPKKKAAAASRSESVPSAGSRGIGRGRSTLDRNYPGIVAAHLARHKQYPAEARSRGIGGVVSVSFSLDGRGRVTSVRLTRSSGVASLDAETQAMVRRASPFPPPPSGQGMSFTVPVSFNLR